MDVLVTSAPMLQTRDEFLPVFENHGVRVTCPTVVQQLTENELVKLVPEFDGWIIGDDPATRTVFEAGSRGKLKAAVKWGVGTDNVDFLACDDLGISIDNTPYMFGAEAADIAVGYLIGLARETFFVDRRVRKGEWPKPRGMSLRGKKVGLVGYGDVGRHAATRIAAFGLDICVYVTDGPSNASGNLEFAKWPEGLEDCNFIVLACSLTPKNRHLVNRDSLASMKRGVRIVNISRGALIDEAALAAALETGQVHSAAMDVFEEEPLNVNSPLLQHERCLFGSHNASNTDEAVSKTNDVAIRKLMSMLNKGRL